MQLAILHHHLNRGGVTQVIQNHLRSLATLPADRRPERVVVFYDGQRDGWDDAATDGIDVRLVVEPSLAYDPPGAGADPEGLARTLDEALTREGFAPEDTLLHTHNHSLGKSASLPGALRRLAEGGWRLLLQVHDFAEDNRPANYRHLATALSGDPTDLGRRLYPQATHAHYATLTERDAEALRTVGVADDRLHTLPNPAGDFEDLPSRDAARGRVLPKLGLSDSTRLIVYPVRGIRRKNLGEMLLLAALAGDGAAFAVTLAPKNPSERAGFDRWRALAERLGLACRFDTGGGYGVAFTDALAAADAVLTTSVAEGFGMVFLEAWLAGRPLVGRDLPGITREFRAAGMRLDRLWESLPVPLGLIDAAEARASLVAMHVESCEAYGLAPLAGAELDAAIGELTAGGAIDFARLTPAQQAELIERVATDPGTRQALSESLGADRLLAADPASDVIEENAAVVRTHYSPAEIGQRLAAVYGAIEASPVGPAPEATGGERLLRCYLSPSQLHAVRLES